MVFVVKQKGESDDRLIARFKKRVFDSGIIEEARERKEFKPPSQLRKEKKYTIKHRQELNRKKDR